MVAVRIALVTVVCLCWGCGGAPETEPRPGSSAMLREIQSIVGKQLGIKPVDVRPDATFTAMGADDLDFVEIILEVEDTLSVAISDDALIQAAGVSKADVLCDRLTIRDFATVVEAAPEQAARVAIQEPDDGGVLRENQVGTHGDLSQLPNPHGLILVFVPDFKDLVRLSEQRLGRKMEADEIDALRQRAAVVALPPDQAEQFESARARREAAAE